jgi:hypothetical protein
MKKWYQRCALVLVTALALQLSGCAKGSAFLSRSSRDKDDKKLVDVDTKAKKKTSSSSKKKSDKAGDSQLAKKSPSKPKVESSDKSKTKPKTEIAAADTKADAQKAIKKASAKESNDPFMSEEFEALTQSKEKAKKAESDTGKKIRADFDEFANKSADSAEKATEKVADAATDGKSKIQEVAHKVEDNLADLGDMPEWAQPGEQAVKKEVAKASTTAKSFAAEAEAEVHKDAKAVNDKVQKVKNSVVSKSLPVESEVSPASVDLVGLCPDAQGELRELVSGLKEADTEGLKRGIHKIGRMGPVAQPAAPALVHLLKHKDGFVRTHSALALARMEASPPDAVQTVVDGLKSTDPGLRSFSAAVLAEMGPQAGEALSTLAESLNDRDGYVRLHSAEVLIRYDRWSYQALETLLGGLSDKDENIRWLATYSLAELAPESQETVEALLKATRDPIMKVKVGAVYALGEIGPFAKSAANELRKLADSATNQELHSAILYALQQIEQ